MSKTEAVVTFAIGLGLLYFAYTQLKTAEPKGVLIGVVAGVIGLYVVGDSAGRAFEALVVPIGVLVAVFAVVAYVRHRRERQANP